MNVVHWKVRDPITEELFSSLLQRKAMMKVKRESIRSNAFENNECSVGNAYKS